jgi:lysyl-tRNA synthetase class 2
MAKRTISKKLIFLTVQDRSGQMQVALRAPTLDSEELSLLRQTLDLGDHIGVAGSVFVTKTGESTLDARTAAILSKTLRPMPDKWAGLQDVESCHRQRYLDLVTNETTRARFRLRSRWCGPFATTSTRTRSKRWRHRS